PTPYTQRSGMERSGSETCDRESASLTSNIKRHVPPPTSALRRTRRADVREVSEQTYSPSAIASSSHALQIGIRGSDLVQDHAEGAGGVRLDADELDPAVLREALLVQVGPHREPAAIEPEHLEIRVVRSVGRPRVVVVASPFDRRELHPDHQVVEVAAGLFRFTGKVGRLRHRSPPGLVAAAREDRRCEEPSSVSFQTPAKVPRARRGGAKGAAASCRGEISSWEGGRHVLSFASTQLFVRVLTRGRVPMIRSLRSLIVSILALWRGLSQKQVGARAGVPQKKVSLYLKREDMEDDLYARFLTAVNGRPAEVAVVTGCLEALAALSPEGRAPQDLDLTAEEEDAVELGVLEVARRSRPILREAVLRSRAEPPLDVYPRPAHLEPARWQAGLLWEALEKLPEGEQMAVVRSDPRHQSWALMEQVCEESVVQASRDLKCAASRARLAEEIARHVRGPEGWRNRCRGYAAGHGANILRVAGKLKTAEADLEKAKELWHAGSDPDGVLDPGRLLNLEGALLRDQRKFTEALGRLAEAAAVSRAPELALIQMGFTLEVMGEYERAIEALLRAEPLIDRQLDSRLWYKQQANLAVIYCN